MLANEVVLRAIQGDVFRFTVQAPWDLTGCSAVCDIRDGDTPIEHLTSTPASGAQWVMVTLIKTGTDTWSLLGDLVA